MNLKKLSVSVPLFAGIALAATLAANAIAGSLYIEYHYYSGPDKAREVGGKTYNCSNPVESWGQVTPYYTKFSEPCSR
jgi:hypothetical protein